MEEVPAKCAKLGRVLILAISYEYILVQVADGKKQRTFGNGEKANKSHRVAVRTSNTVMNKSVGHIQRVVLILTRCDGNGGLVAAENNGDKR